MLTDTPANIQERAALGVPFASEAGIHYHIAIQFQQQGAHDLAASHYRAASELAVPGDLRDHCLLRFRQLTIRALDAVPA